MFIRHTPLMAPAETEGAVADAPEVASGFESMADNFIAGLGADAHADATPSPKPSETAPKPAAKPEATPADKAAAEAKPGVVEAKPADAAKPAETAAAKEGDKPTATAEEQQFDKDFPDVTSPRGKDFKAIKGRYKEDLRKWQSEKTSLSAKATELEAKVKELESRPAPEPAKPDAASDERVKSLEAKITELSDALIVANVERHPDYVKHYESRFKEVNAREESAKSRVLATLGKDKGEKFLEILGLPENEYRRGQLNEFLGELSPSEQQDAAILRSSLLTVAEQRAAVQRDQQADIASAKEKQTQFEAMRTAESAKNAQARDAVLANRIKALEDPKTGNVLFQEKPGDEEWNKGVRTRKAVVSGLIKGEGVTSDQVMDAALQAAAFPEVVRRFAVNETAWKAKETAWTKEKADLEAKIASMTASQPRSGHESGQTAAKPALKIGEATPDEVDNHFADKMMTDVEASFSGGR